MVRAQWRRPRRYTINTPTMYSYQQLEHMPPHMRRSCPVENDMDCFAVLSEQNTNCIISKAALMVVSMNFQNSH